MNLQLLDPPTTLSVAQMVREYTKHFKKIKKSDKPTFITVNGKAEIVTLGIEQYKELLKYIRSLEEKDTKEAIEISAKEEKDGKLKKLSSLKDLT